jgi:hypothetical protein
MRQLIFIATFIVFLAAHDLQAQRPEVKTGDPERLAGQWIERLNALDEWYLSPEGKEDGLDKVVDQMMELYAPDVIADLPPHDQDQIGPVMLRGSGQLRKWVEKIARTHVRIDYILARQTGKEFEGVELVYSTPLPWGGLGISFPVIAAYSSRHDRRRFMAPGMVVLQFGTDGKIHKFRLYLTELGEVLPI